MRRQRQLLLSMVLVALVLTLSVVPALATTVPKLVSTEWLSENMQAPDLVILDVRDNAADYAFSHIRGAVDAPLGNWRATVNGIVGMLPPIPDIQKYIRSLGVNNDSAIVVYSAGQSAVDIAAAARVVWTFEYLGHENVGLLNGGFAAWQIDVADMYNETVTPKEGNFTANPQPDLLATKDYVKEHLGDKTVTLCDSRPAAQYFGVSKTDTTKAFGHLPGAKCFPGEWQTAGTPPALLLPIHDLAAMASGVGIPADKQAQLVTYCNTGHWASLGYFILRDVLGYKNVRMYDGSMTEWTMDPSAPVVRYAWEK